MNQKNKLCDLKLISLNIRGLNDDTKRNKVFCWLRQCDADVILLQETHCGSEKDLWRWNRQWGGTSYWSTTSSQSKGVAILFKQGKQYDITEYEVDLNGRMMYVDIAHDEQYLRLINVYAPNNAKDRKVFFKALTAKYIDQEKDMVIGGDFNQ